MPTDGFGEEVPMIVLVGLYVDASAERLCEYLTCIERNAANRSIDAVHVFIEDGIDPAELTTQYPQLTAAKVRLVLHGRRVTYRDFFDYANRELPGRQVIIANADIFFDHTLSRLDSYSLAGRLLCLSRWDLQADGSWQLFDFERSQDAWIFEAPVPEISCDFHLGLLGCDNRLAWEAERAGLVLSNPSRSIRAYHQHASGIRRYTEAQRLHGPMRGVRPEHLDTAAVSRETGVRDEGRDIPCAAVAFRETMGYTIDRLRLGVSSHNNDERPFTAIPERLAGRSFTQVVSRSASSVEVQFLSSGRLYVLVGTDWEGYSPATDWLGGVGDREPMPLLETCHRPAFEVWSLLGEQGARFVIPTQVMLVSESLERMASIANDPLVSCIMPTFDRRAFIPQAIHCFLAQDYPHLELVVVDDGSDPIADLLPSDPRILYIRTEPRMTVGAKRNLACERARGEIIVHWDDDDWYPPSARARAGRRRCASAVPTSAARASSTSSIASPAAPGATATPAARRHGSRGTTLAYRREAWERNRFPDDAGGRRLPIRLALSGRQRRRSPRSVALHRLGSRGERQSERHHRHVLVAGECRAHRGHPPRRHAGLPAQPRIIVGWAGELPGTLYPAGGGCGSGTWFLIGLIVRR